MKTTAATLALALSLAAASTARAQDAAAGPERGRTSISVTAQSSPVVGIWTRLSDRTDVGLNVGLAYARFGIEDDDQSERLVRVEPALKRYLGARDGFAPYARVALFGELGEEEQEEEGTTFTVEQRSFGGSAAFGVDWFPARRISIGGHVGLSAGVQDFSASASEFDAEVEGDGLFAGTFSSGLVVHLYF